MEAQSELKKEWIFRTLDRMTNPQRIEADLLVSVFNIPKADAIKLLKQYKGEQ